MKYARYAFTALLAVSFGVAATPKDGMNTTGWEKAKKAYIYQLSANNPGVVASAANFVRKYNIVEATDALKTILLCDHCEAVKVSAALALVEVAGDEGVKTIKEAMKTEENELVIAFYNVILHADSEKYIAPISEN
jgi:hypothetical protein